MSIIIEVYVRASGPSRSALKRAIGQLIVTKGGKKHKRVGWSSIPSLTSRQCSDLVAEIYRLEGRYSDTFLTEVSISGGVRIHVQLRTFRPDEKTKASP